MKAAYLIAGVGASFLAWRYLNTPNSPMASPAQSVTTTNDNWRGNDMSKVNRGIRNNNPLNIKKGNNWKGETAVSSDPIFETYTDPKYGFRAGAILLKNYQRLYGLSTVRELINRFAPSSENNTNNYVAFVAGQMGVSENQSLDLNDSSTLAKMMHAMSVMEVGRYYSLSDALSGVKLA
jgi:hypothetical protein